MGVTDQTGHQTWQQVPLPSEPSCLPRHLFLTFNVIPHGFVLHGVQIIDSLLNLILERVSGVEALSLPLPFLYEG